MIHIRVLMRERVNVKSDVMCITVIGKDENTRMRCNSEKKRGELICSHQISTKLEDMLAYNSRLICLVGERGRDVPIRQAKSCSMLSTRQHENEPMRLKSGDGEQDSSLVTKLDLSIHKRIIEDLVARMSCC